LPYITSLVAKKKGNKLYYYVVESARVDGKPRIVPQAYLGTAEKLAEMVRERTAPVPLSASMREFGLPAAPWSAAVETGVWDLLCSLWPAPRSGPSLAHCLLLAAIHRICAPGPKTEVADWYSHSILAPLWGLDAERLRSQDFWDAFEQILPADEQDLPLQEDPLDQAQLPLLGLWKQKQMVSHRLLAYDTTNFYTYIASSNGRNQVAQRGHNKQGRHNLRQVGLSYVLDGENGLSLCHHVYPGKVADVDEFSTALGRITWMLDQKQMERESVTLELDEGLAALANPVALEEARLGWISALPWNQAPAQLRSRVVEQLPLCGASQPGVRAAAAFDPCFANRAERRKVILAVFHECQVCDERDVYAETRQGFNEASQPLRRRIKNPVHTRRIVETVAKGPVFLLIGPIRNRPCVVISADTEKRPRGPLRFEIHSIRS
jgi:hypothetical protein